jgi:hypothetical protein
MKSEYKVDILSQCQLPDCDIACYSAIATQNVAFAIERQWVKSAQDFSVHYVQN